MLEKDAETGNATHVVNEYIDELQKNVAYYMDNTSKEVPSFLDSP